VVHDGLLHGYSELLSNVGVGIFIGAVIIFILLSLCISILFVKLTLTWKVLYLRLLLS
jgi:hypothetical protein